MRCIIRPQFKKVKNLNFLLEALDFQFERGFRFTAVMSQMLQIQSLVWFFTQTER